jgi:hypothetical protein
MTEGSYVRVKCRTFIGIMSKGQGLYDSFTFENKGATVLETSGTTKSNDRASHPRRTESPCYFLLYKNITSIKVAFSKSSIIMHYFKIQN